MPLLKFQPSYKRAFWEKIKYFAWMLRSELFWATRNRIKSKILVKTRYSKFSRNLFSVSQNRQVKRRDFFIACIFILLYVQKWTWNFSGFEQTEQYLVYWNKVLQSTPQKKVMQSVTAAIMPHHVIQSVNMFIIIADLI